MTIETGDWVRHDDTVMYPSVGQVTAIHPAWSSAERGIQVDWPEIDSPRTHPEHVITFVTRGKAPDAVNHPAHYGGDTTYETIKVIQAWGLNFELGSAVKYISRAEHKGNKIQDLEKAIWYLREEIKRS